MGIGPGSVIRVPSLPHLIHAGPTRIDPPSPGAQKRNSPSLLTDQFPGFKSLPFGFTQIAVANPAIAVGASAWIGLGRWTVGGTAPFDIQQEVGIYGITLELGPTDNVSAADISWGTTLGLGGAIVVGTNLPFGAVGAVSASTAFIPGVEATGNGALLAQRQSAYLFDTGFASGKFTDGTPNKAWLRITYAPYIFRVNRGTTIDAALVIRGSQINGQTGNINGLCRGFIDIGLPEHEVFWTE